MGVSAFSSGSPLTAKACVRGGASVDIAEEVEAGVVGIGVSQGGVGGFGWFDAEDFAAGADDFDLGAGLGEGDGDGSAGEGWDWPLREPARWKVRRETSGRKRGLRGRLVQSSRAAAPSQRVEP